MKLFLSAVVMLNMVFYGIGAFGEEVKTQAQIYPKHKELGKQSGKSKESYFIAINDVGKLQKKQGAVQNLSFGSPDPYEHTEFQLGYLPFTATTSTNLVNIQTAKTIQSSSTLTRIDVRLDKLRVYDYPGSGNHKVMFTFKADNSLVQKEAGKESIAFSQVYEAQEGQGAGISGYPVFIGLNVGKQGAAFQGCTINVQNDSDEKVLNVLKSDQFKGGLALLTTAQPALAPLASIGTGIGEMVLGRNKNKKIHEFFIGLDYDNNAAYGARLAVGNYIVVQAPDEAFTWDMWAYDPRNARIVNRLNGQPIPYNYVIFRVSQHVD